MGKKPETLADPDTSKPTSRIQDILYPAILGLFGAMILATTVPPVFSIGVGALITAFLVRRRQTREYAFSGTVFLIGFGLLLAVVPMLGSSYSDAAQNALLIAGGLYFVFLLFKQLIKSIVSVVGQRYFETDTLSEIWDMGASVWGLVYIVWNVIQMIERVIRSIVLAIATPSSVAVNLIYSNPGTEFGSWVYSVSLIVFIVSVLLGFHTLATWHSASKVKDGVSSGAEEIMESIRKKRESSDGKKSRAR